MHANAECNRPIARGDIAAVVGFKDIKTGDTLSDEKNKVFLSQWYS